jgi:hypothetical protein
MLLAFTLAQAQPFGVPQAPVYKVTIASGGVTNVNALIDCTHGKELFISASYQCATNLQAAVAGNGATMTNIIVVFQAGDQLGNWGGNGGFSSSAEVPVTWTLTIPGNTVGTTNFAFTNITVNALPYVRCRYITNSCGSDANSIVTNLTLRYWSK